jgi:hypothetical protein
VNAAAPFQEDGCNSGCANPMVVRVVRAAHGDTVAQVGPGDAVVPVVQGDTVVPVVEARSAGLFVGFELVDADLPPVWVMYTRADFALSFGWCGSVWSVGCGSVWSDGCSWASLVWCIALPTGGCSLVLRGDIRLLRRPGWEQKASREERRRALVQPGATFRRSGRLLANFAFSYFLYVLCVSCFVLLRVLHSVMKRF